MECIEPVLAAGFQPHINQVKTGITHPDEEFAIECVGAAIYLPDHFTRQCVAMQFINELTRPAPPNSSEQRKVVVLKKKNSNATLLVKHAHLSHDFRRLACADYLSRSGAIKRVNGA